VTLDRPRVLLCAAAAVLVLLGAAVAVARGGGDEADLVTVTATAGGTEGAPVAPPRPTPATAATAVPPAPGTAPPPGAVTPATPPAAPRPTAASDPALPVGTCLEVPSRPTDVASVTPVDCAQPHTGEVFLSTVLPQGADAPYPGRDALEAQALSTCQGQAFTDYVGVPYTDSVFFAFVLVPTDGSWAAGDRDVSCFLSDITAGPVTGSQRGSAR
jgi:hypothetical protein